MLKKCLLFLLVLIGVLPAVSLPAYASSFPDVDAQKYSWAQEAIDQLAERQVIQGFKDGTFKPDRQVTKAEFTVMVYRLFPKLRAAEPKSIPGVPQTYWARKEFSLLYSTIWPIYAADKQNWDDETYSYSPNKMMTRWDVLMTLDALFGHMDAGDDEDEQAIMRTLALTRDVKKKVIGTEHNDPWWVTSTMSPVVGIDQYSDSGIQVTADIEYLKAVALHRFVSLGVMTTDRQGYFYPFRPVTRAELAAILYRLYQIVGEDFAPYEPPGDPIPNDLSRSYDSPDGSVGQGGNLFYDPEDAYYVVFQPSLIDGREVQSVTLRAESEHPVDVYVSAGDRTTKFTYEQLTDEAHPATLSVSGLLYIKVHSIARHPELLTEKGNNDYMIYVDAY